LNNLPQVSVVIPTYNRARFVVEAIESALTQEEVTLEVLVIDDGGTDDTQDGLDKMQTVAGGRVRYIRQENSGASAARNHGIREARAPLIALLDSDDVWLPGKLARQVEELALHPDAVAHFTDVCIERSFARGRSLFEFRNMKWMFQGDEALRLERPLEQNIRYNFARNQSAMIRRDALFAAGLYNEAFSRFQDTDLMNRVALEGPWIVSPTVAVREIRRVEDILAIGDETRSRPQIGYEALLTHFTTLSRDPRLSKSERAASLSALSVNGFRAASSYIRSSDHSSARRVLVASLREHPDLRGILALFSTFIPNRLLRMIAFRDTASSRV
jgi:glycosyltransferase involved in cell wall biosynthesis